MLKRWSFSHGCSDLDAQKASFASALRDIASSKDLSHGHLLHSCILQSQLWQDGFLSNLLLQMYGKCDSLVDSLCLFSHMRHRDKFGWNFMIRALDEDGHSHESIMTFNHMLREGCLPDKHILTSVISACASEKDLVHGMQIHAIAAPFGAERDPAVGANLVNMYGKCGRIVDSSRVFYGLRERTVIAWTVLIAAHAEYGNCKDVIELLDEMREDGIALDKITFLSVVSSCANRAVFSDGQIIHKIALESGFGPDQMVSNAFIDMYGKCSSIKDAFNVFMNLSNPDLVSWSAIIGAFARCGHSREASKQFLQMYEEGFLPNRVTFINVLSAFTMQEFLCEGKKLHVAILCQGFDSDISIETCVLNMYKHCGSPREALVIYKKLNVKDEAANISIFSICASYGFLKDGREAHSFLAKNGTDIEKNISIALLNMYGKCGCLEEAERMFKLMQKSDAIMWNVMAATYAQNGQGIEVVNLFQEMLNKEVKPDKATYSTCLTACSHTGMVSEALSCFLYIDEDIETKPVEDQYNCMVDLIARIGRLDVACELVDLMPRKPTAITWLTLLSICRVQACVKLAQYSAKHIMELAPEEPGTYVMLANIYCHDDDLDE